MATLGPSSRSMRGRTNCSLWRRRLELLGLVVAASIFSTCAAADQRPCIWDHYSGATFDLSGLKKTAASYHIYDGDDPCTRIEEESYDYYFNICGDVVGPIPEACSETGSSKGTRGSAIQFDKRTKKCNVIGEYEPKLDEYMWTLFKETDPSKGVSIKQVAPKYICSNGAQRTFTIDVVCANKLDPVVTYAREPEHCQYHAEVLSVHGCPKECPYTSNGLCDSHGHCAYDPTIKAPHCYCNEGHGGADCSRTLAMSSAGSGSHFHVQIGLLVTLLILILAMVGVVGYMVLQVYSYRKDAAGRYSSFAGELSRIGRDGF